MGWGLKEEGVQGLGIDGGGGPWDRGVGLKTKSGRTVGFVKESKQSSNQLIIFRSPDHYNINIDKDT